SSQAGGRRGAAGRANASEAASRIGGTIRKGRPAGFGGKGNQGNFHPRSLLARGRIRFGHGRRDRGRHRGNGCELAEVDGRGNQSGKGAARREDSRRQNPFRPRKRAAVQNGLGYAASEIRVSNGIESRCHSERSEESLFDLDASKDLSL